MKQLHIANVHRALGAQFVEFAGWEMPVVYTTVAEEHLAVREAAGLFDVSHMGEFKVRGSGALAFLQRVTTNDVSKLVIGAGQYSTVPNEHGGLKDDIIVYRLAEEEYLVVCNASNVEKIWNWFVQQKGPACELEDITDTTALFAIQGPKAQSILQRLTTFDLNQVSKRYKTASIDVAGIESTVARSGYTGEDGFEIFIMNESFSSATRAEKLWKEILKAGKDLGIKPCGLGARDTTRLEAGLCLYGNELSEDISPLEARIDFVVKLDKGDFIGRDALLMQKGNLKRARVGLSMLEAGIPRHGYEISHDGEKVGSVTSGTFSPLLKIGIAMGYIPPSIKEGEKVEVEVHGKQRVAKIVSLPFYDPTKYGRTRKQHG